MNTTFSKLNNESRSLLFSSTDQNLYKEVSSADRPRAEQILKELASEFQAHEDEINKGLEKLKNKQFCFQAESTFGGTRLYVPQGGDAMALDYTKAKVSCLFLLTQVQ